MIPVRIKSDTKPVIPTDRVITMNPDHPLAHTQCPVCDVQLVARPVVLVFVGIAPEDRERATGYATGAAVTVHADCAGVEA